MLYETLQIKDKEYKLRLTARNCVDLEKKLGTNPLNVLMKLSDGQELPSIDVLLQILHASLQTYEHGISLDDTYSLYDDFVDDGKTLMDLIPVVLSIFKVSGFFKEDKNAKNSTKRVAK